MSTPEHRAEWRRLEQAATPGEWWVGDKTAASWHGNELQVIAPDESPEHEVQAAILATLNAYFPHARQDAAFLAAARTAVPALLEDVDRLEAENAQLRAELREALLEIAGTPPEALWEMEDQRMDYVTIQVDKPVYAAARKRLKELRCQEGSEGSTS